MVFTHTIQSVKQLQNQISGSLLTPDDAGYEAIRQGWDLTVEHHPALILLPHNPDDIAAGIRFAREAGLGVAVQSTGHGRLYPADDSLLIHTSEMDGLYIDPQARTARVEAGVTWHAVLDQAAPHGLASLLGSSPHVGVVGYMLGGGIGWLVRRYGFGADSIRWIDIVTADGVLRHASPNENQDLFWGLPGGGGNFGVVTAMEFDLYPVATVYGGGLTYPAELASEALHFYRAWIKTLPDGMTSSVAIQKFPPLPQLPGDRRGKTLVLVGAVYSGETNDGIGLMRAWFNWHTPISSTFREMPFSEVGTITNDPTDPTTSFASSDMLNDLSDEAIDVIVRYATNKAAPPMFSVLRHAGGAAACVPTSTNAVGNRDAKLFLLMAGAAPSRQGLEPVKKHIQACRTALQPYLRGGVWMNFMNGNGGGARERIREAYLPEAYERLLRLKNRYDPDNLFRYSYQLKASDD